MSSHVLGGPKQTNECGVRTVSSACRLIIPYRFPEVRITSGKRWQDWNIESLEILVNVTCLYINGHDSLVPLTRVLPRSVRCYVSDRSAEGKAILCPKSACRLTLWIQGPM